MGLFKGFARNHSLIFQPWGGALRRGKTLLSFFVRREWQFFILFKPSFILLLAPKPHD